MTPPIDPEEFARAERAVELILDRLRRIVVGELGDDHDPLELADITAPTLRVMVASLASLVAGMITTDGDPMGDLAYLETHYVAHLAELRGHLEDVDG